MKHRDSIDVICAAVAGSFERPREFIVGLALDGELRIVGRTGPLTAGTASILADHLQNPAEAPVWPDSIPSEQW